MTKWKQAAYGARQKTGGKGRYTTTSNLAKSKNCQGTWLAENQKYKQHS